jgi:hypothetical protein
MEIEVEVKFVDLCLIVGVALSLVVIRQSLLVLAGLVYLQ